MAIGYQPGLGRAGEKLLEVLQNWSRNFGPAQWAEKASHITQRWTAEQNRLARLEQRLIDSELGPLRSHSAQRKAAKFLNQQMAGKKFSEPVIRFLQDDWYGELQWCLLHQEDATAPQWPTWALLTSQLIQSLQPLGDDPQEKQERYALVPEIGTAIRTALSKRFRDIEQLENQLAHIEHQHLLLLTGKQQEYAPFEPIASDDPFLTHAQLSRELLAAVDTCAPGQWFNNVDAEPQARMKLILKAGHPTLCLFTNRLGIKTLQITAEDFAYALANGSFVRLPETDSFSLRQRLLAQLLAMAEQNMAAHREALVLARERADTAARERIEAKAKAIAQARALEKKAAQAATSSSPSDIVRQLPLAPAESTPVGLDLTSATPAVPAQTDEQRQRSARQQTALLPIGSWVELPGEEGTSQRLKLAVKLPSTGKLIFVDRSGARRAELARDRFTELLIAGQVRILNQGPQFEDTLARVVDGLRRERQWRE